MSHNDPHHPLESAEHKFQEAKGHVTAAGHPVEEQVKELAGKVRSSAHHVASEAREHRDLLRFKAGHCACTEYVKKNPVPVVLGALVFGAALGYTIFSGRRSACLGERLADAGRTASDRFIAAFDAARGRAQHAAEDLPSADCVRSHFRKVGDRLKFW